MYEYLNLIKKHYLLGVKYYHENRSCDGQALVLSELVVEMMEKLIDHHLPNHLPMHYLSLEP
jgi:hypothetical protein